MKYIFCNSFIIEAEDETELYKKTDGRDTWCTFSDALSDFFMNSVFVCNIEKSIYGIKKCLLYYGGGLNSKTYIINNSKKERFLSKYFPQKTIITRKPQFFTVLIPKLKIVLDRSGFYENNSDIIRIDNFTDNFYRSVEKCNVRLRSEVWEKHCQWVRVYISEANAAIELALDYFKFISELMNTRLNEEYIDRLITPCFMIDSKELLEVHKLQSEKGKIYMHEAVEENERRMDEKFYKWRFGS